VHGEWPDGLIDHINGETQDNRLHNLRVVDHTGNGQNRRLGKNSSSGVLGVFLFKPTGKWRAHIRHNGRQIALGDFANFEDAVQARAEAEQQLWQQTTP